MEFAFQSFVIFTKDKIIHADLFLAVVLIEMNNKIN